REPPAGGAVQFGGRRGELQPCGLVGHLARQGKFGGIRPLGHAVQSSNAPPRDAAPTAPATLGRVAVVPRCPCAFPPSWQPPSRSPSAWSLRPCRRRRARRCATSTSSALAPSAAWCRTPSPPWARTTRAS